MPLTEAAGLFVGHARPTVGSGRDPSVGLAMPPAKSPNLLGVRFLLGGFFGLVR
jgi:hypothetical protein